jgi:hypothetical protein
MVAEARVIVRSGVLRFFMVTLRGTGGEGQRD